jgi:predicted RND superfamily exporter protein
LKSLRETGKSMVYTSLILFAGFVIFTGSDFGGTVALGVLTSTTLLVAMLTNLLVLPSLLMTFKSNK